MASTIETLVRKESEKTQTKEHKPPLLICPICYTYEDQIKPASFDLPGPYCFPACSKEHMISAYQHNIPRPYKYYNQDEVIAPKYVWVSSK